MLINIIDCITVNKDDIEVLYKIDLESYGADISVATAQLPTNTSLIFENNELFSSSPSSHPKSHIKRYPLPR
ncbi:MAG: hypothetical protein LBP79_04845 [Clostridiales bacterium]|jgi:hypothetical protein|nr:hypothetical protein [Clostridiales bacterium]